MLVALPTLALFFGVAAEPLQALGWTAFDVAALGIGAIACVLLAIALSFDGRFIGRAARRTWERLRGLAASRRIRALRDRYHDENPHDGALTMEAIKHAKSEEEAHLIFVRYLAQDPQRRTTPELVYRGMAFLYRRLGDEQEAEEWERSSKQALQDRLWPMLGGVTAVTGRYDAEGRLAGRLSATPELGPVPAGSPLGNLGTEQ